MSMRVLHITRQFFPAVGGIENALNALACALSARGHTCDILTLNRTWDQPARVLPSEEWINGLRVLRVPYRGPRQYAVAPQFLKYLNGYDLIHLHSSDYFLDAVYWSGVSRRLPVVLTSHGFYFHTRFAGVLKPLVFRTLTRLAARSLRRVICVSQSDARRAAVILPPEKLTVIPNGIDPRFLDLPAGPRESGLILSVGRLAANKGHARLLRAFAHLASRQDGARLALVGGDYGELPELRRLAASLGIDDRVIFTGEVLAPRLLDWYRRAAVFVSASEYESFGIAALEAMAAGCYSVLADIPAYRELSGGGKYALIADFSSPEAAARVLEAALDPAARAAGGVVEAARVYASQYTWSEIARRVEEVYFDAARAG